jgi:hypothetical protein
MKKLKRLSKAYIKMNETYSEITNFNLDLNEKEGRLKTL